MENEANRNLTAKPVTPSGAKTGKPPVTPVSQSPQKPPFFSKNKKILIILGLVLLAIIGILFIFYLSAANKTRKLNDARNQVYQAIKKGDYTTAQKAAKEGFATDSNDPYLLKSYIDATTAQGNRTGKEAEALKTVEPYIQDLLKGNENDADALLSAGYAYETAGYYKEAYDLYVKATQLNPKNAQAWFHKGHVLEFSQNPQDPTEEYELAYSLDHEDPLILMAMGKLSYNKLKQDEALNFYLKAASAKITTNTLRAEALTNASRIRRDQMLYMKEAIALSKQAVDADPNFSPALTTHGFNLGINGKFDEGILYMQKAINANPRISENYWNMGFLLSTVKRYDESLVYFKAALNAFPNDNTILGTRNHAKLEASYKYRIALITSLSGKNTDVVKLLSEAIAQNPELKVRLKEDYSKLNRFSNMASDKDFLNLVK